MDNLIKPTHFIMLYEKLKEISNFNLRSLRRCHQYFAIVKSKKNSIKKPTNFFLILRLKIKRGNSKLYLKIRCSQKFISSYILTNIYCKYLLRGINIKLLYTNNSYLGFVCNKIFYYLDNFILIISISIHFISIFWLINRLTNKMHLWVI